MGGAVTGADFGAGVISLRVVFSETLLPGWAPMASSLAGETLGPVASESAPPRRSMAFPPQPARRPAMMTRVRRCFRVAFIRASLLAALPTAFRCRYSGDSDGW